MSAPISRTRPTSRKLAEASRLGAYKHAQEIVAAYEILRDPVRRYQYDKHGIVAQPRRVPWDDRFNPPRAVPFRSWSPAEGWGAAGAAHSSLGPSPRPSHRHSRRRGVAPGQRRLRLLAMVLLGVLLVVLMLRMAMVGR